MSPRARHALKWLLWVWLGTFTFAALDYPIGDGDESVHALVLQEMMRSGDWLHMRWQGAEVLQRPQTPYWLAAPFAALIPGELGYRLSSALFSLLTLVVVYRTAMRLWGRADAAALAVLLLSASPSYHVYSRTLMSDPPFVLALTVALSGALLLNSRANALYWVAGGLGAAVACKSLAAAVPGLALAPFVIVHTVRGESRSRTGRAALVLLLFALPYYLLGIALHGYRFIEEHIIFNLVKRASSGYGLGLGDSVWSYVSWVPTGDGPLVSAWLLLGSLGAAGVAIWKRDRALLLLGGYSSAVVGLMSLLAMKLPHYLLPAYPAAALGVAGLYRLLSDHVVHKTAVAAATLTLAVVVGLASRTYPGGSRWLMTRAAGRDLGAVVRETVPSNATVHAYEWYGPSLAFYGERRVVLLTSVRSRFDAINFGAIQRSGCAQLAPPKPARDDATLFVSGTGAALKSASWMRIRRVLGQSHRYFLVEASLVDAHAAGHSGGSPAGARP